MSDWRDDEVEEETRRRGARDETLGEGVRILGADRGGRAGRGGAVPASRRRRRGPDVVGVVVGVRAAAGRGAERIDAAAALVRAAHRARCRGSSPTTSLRRRPRLLVRRRRGAPRASAPTRATGPAATSRRVSSRTTTRPSSARSPTTTTRGRARSPRRRPGVVRVGVRPAAAARWRSAGRPPSRREPTSRCRPMRRPRGRGAPRPRAASTTRAAARQRRPTVRTASSPGVVVGAVALVAFIAGRQATLFLATVVVGRGGVRALRGVPPRRVPHGDRRRSPRLRRDRARSPTTRARRRSR